MYYAVLLHQQQQKQRREHHTLGIQIIHVPSVVLKYDIVVCDDADVRANRFVHRMGSPRARWRPISPPNPPPPPFTPISTAAPRAPVQSQPTRLCLTDVGHTIWSIDSFPRETRGRLVVACGTFHRRGVIELSEWARERGGGEGRHRLILSVPESL